MMREGEQASSFNVAFNHMESDQTFLYNFSEKFKYRLLRGEFILLILRWGRIRKLRQMSFYGCNL